MTVSIRGMPNIWIIAWLFTVGYAGLGFWQSIMAFFIWPYYLGLLAAS